MLVELPLPNCIKERLMDAGALNKTWSMILQSTLCLTNEYSEY